MAINLEKQFEELGQLVYLGKHKEAIKTITKLEKNNNLNDSQLTNLLSLKAQVLYGLGKFKGAFGK